MINREYVFKYFVYLVLKSHNGLGKVGRKDYLQTTLPFADL